MNSKWGPILCSLAIGLEGTFLAGVASATDQAEPTYEGRNLSDWTRDLDPHGYYIAEPHAWTAIRHMGTNTIPTLLKWLSEADPPEVPRTNVAACFNTTRSQRAEMAFSILGETARPAIPELTRLARTGREVRCVECLASIGPEAVSSLLSLATNSPSLSSWHAFHALYDFQRTPVAVAIAPALIQCLYDKREDVIAEAASLLAVFELPDIVVPALTNALQSSSAVTRSWAVWCLGTYEKEELPRSNIPLLRAAMGDPDPRVRKSATSSLRSLGGWQLDNQGQWFRVGGTNTLHGITADFFTDPPR